MKNLENVQGDERDVILFSVGYGPDKRGKVSMNFGPLNNTGGERRLNVAVSRARYEMMVFSTLQPEQIDLRRSNARGVEGLKHFLEFARNGRMAVAANQIQAKETASDIVEAVATEIRKLGYEVDTSVGRSQFKVDIAVLDPESPDKYILGIMCDGKNYYETKTERDREICQPGVLKGLSWNLMRLWSVDWFMNKDAVMKRISDQLNNKKKVNDAPAAAKQPATNAKQPAASTQQPAPNTLLGFAVGEDELVSIVNERVRPYNRVAIRGNHDGTVEHLMRSQKSVANDIQKIIDTEQPVTQSLVFKRMAEIYQLPRLTPKVQTFLAQFLNAWRDPASPADNPTYWRSAEDAQGYIFYRENSGRDITDIPSIEIENAARYAVEEQISIPLDDLKRQTARMLGFNRNVAKVDITIEQAIAMLIDKGVLTEDNGAITLPA
jgi:hypothetical protein